jgi:hypothetical protein
LPNTIFRKDSSAAAPANRLLLRRPGEAAAAACSRREGSRVPPRSAAALGATHSSHSFLWWRNPNAGPSLATMDFASRHAVAEPAPAPAPSAGAEEPEYLARYLIVKHSWRGRYRRILCIASSGVVTLDPAMLNLTNSYDAGTEFDRAEPLAASDEFTLAVRTDPRSKFKPMRFSSPLRVGILTKLHRLRSVHPAVDFPVLHLRRRTHEWTPLVSARPSSQILPPRSQLSIRHSG